MRPPSDDDLREQAERRRSLAEHWGEHAEAEGQSRRLQMERAMMVEHAYPAALARLKKGVFGVAQALKNGALEPEEAWAKLTTLFEAERAVRMQVVEIGERIDQVRSLDQAAMTRLAGVLDHDVLIERVANPLPLGAGAADTGTSPCARAERLSDLADDDDAEQRL